MKVIKIILLVLFLILVGVFGYQNREFFLETQHLSIDLVYFNYQSEVQVGLITALFFAMGVLGTFLFTLVSRFESSHAIKVLAETRHSHLQKIAELEKEIKALETKSTTQGQT